MPLSNTEIAYYDSNVLRLPADKRAEYHEQVDRLVEELSRSLKDRTKIKITKVMKAGSFAKFTILRKTSVDPVDVDVVFFVSGRSVDQETLAGLTQAIYDLLVEIYPTKDVKDFEIQRKAATVTFVKSGISVDVVPVVADELRPGYGWQFDVHDPLGGRVETCPPAQIQFVRDRKAKDPHFRTLVRMAKKWRNHAELGALKSFAIELIMAHLQDRDGRAESIEAGFRRFLLYLAQSELKEEVSFPENAAPFPPFSDPVVVRDPVCSWNNVTARITERERVAIVAAAGEAWEVANLASADDDEAVWKELFGPRFKVEA